MKMMVNFVLELCNRAISLSESYKAKLELIKEFECKELVFPVTNFTKEHWDVLKEKLTTDPKGYRGLKEYMWNLQSFHEIDAVTNKVKKQYYPISKDNKFSGIKIRQEPKAFMLKVQMILNAICLDKLFLLSLLLSGLFM